MKKVSFLLCGILAVTLFACKQKTAEFGFYGKELTMTTIGDEIMDYTGQLNQATITFTKEGNTIAGNLGCNLYNGSFKMDGDKLSFTNIATTVMACDSANNELETKMLDVINQTDNYEVTENELKLKAGDKVLAICQPGIVVVKAPVVETPDTVVAEEPAVEEQPVAKATTKKKTTQPAKTEAAGGSKGIPMNSTGGKPFPKPDAQLQNTEQARPIQNPDELKKQQIVKQVNKAASSTTTRSKKQAALEAARAKEAQSSN